MVYAASSRALAQLEKRVHANGVAPARQALIRLELPEDALIQDAQADLGLESARWRQDEGYTQNFGAYIFFYDRPYQGAERFETISWSDVYLVWVRRG